MTLFNGDCLEVMQGLESNSVDLVLTDPPYGLAFMGKKWDYDVPAVAVWAEALRVLKPGGHLLAFAGTRTQHRMACRIEDAGFEIRDMLAWVYGSGFPKSLDVSKAIDKAAGIWRGRAGDVSSPNGSMGGPNYQRTDKGDPATDAARDWAGWGTALKPALEPITMARKPLVGTVAANVLEYGTGGLNIDACRVGTGQDKGVWPITQRRHNDVAWTVQPVETDTATGRWPANLLHDGSEEVTALFPMTKSGAMKRQVPEYAGDGATQFLRGRSGPENQHADSGSAARFFYCAKASKRERDAGCEGMEKKAAAGVGALRDGARTGTARSNTHPTVKPIALMEYLVQLTSRPGAVVLDPFMGSGTTGIACRNLNREFIGIERDPDYFKLAEARINHTPDQLELPA